MAVETSSNLNSIWFSNHNNTVNRSVVLVTYPFTSVRLLLVVDSLLISIAADWSDWDCSFVEQTCTKMKCKDPLAQCSSNLRTWSWNISWSRWVLEVVTFDLYYFVILRISWSSINEDEGAATNLGRWGEGAITEGGRSKFTGMGDEGCEGWATEDGGVDEGSLLLRLLRLRFAGGEVEVGEIEDEFSWRSGEGGGFGEILWRFMEI